MTQYPLVTDATPARWPENVRELERDFARIQPYLAHARAIGIVPEFQGPYRFLSNFFGAPIEHDGIRYPAVEHAYQAHKTADPDLRRKIASLTSGGAKHAGRRLPFVPDWEERKLGIMREIVRKKFRAHPVLARALLLTGDAKIVEQAPWGDRFWGVCAGQGRNELGKLLMEIRAALRTELSGPDAPASAERDGEIDRPAGHSGGDT